MRVKQLTEPSDLLDHQVRYLSAGVIKVVPPPRDSQPEGGRDVDEEGESHGAQEADVDDV